MKWLRVGGQQSSVSTLVCRLQCGAARVLLKISLTRCYHCIMAGYFHAWRLEHFK